MEFTCKWCSEIKPEDAFVRRDPKKPYSDGNIRCCKACNTKRNRERYKVPEIRDKQLAANDKWRKENPEKMDEYIREFNQRTPRNMKARNKVGSMIRSGYWTKQPCEICGTWEWVEAHHDSYAEEHWTTVRWLCKTHHEKWHQVLDPVKGPILEEPLAKVIGLRKEHDEIQKQMAVLRKQALALKQEADALDLKAWTEVQLVAAPLFKQTFKK